MERVRAVAALVLTVALFGGVTEGKVYEKCELTELLRAGLTKAKDTTIEKIVCHVSQSSNYDSSAVNTLSVPNDNSAAEPWTLYGIFQIPHHFCQGQNGQSALCGSDCTEFTDDDITNDIQCVDKIKNTFLHNPNAASRVYKEIIPKLFTPNCQESIISDCSN